MRIQSDKPLANGGYLHRGSEAPKITMPPRPKQAGYEDPEFDAELWYRTMRHVIKWEPMETWATKLGLPIETLDIMGGCTLGPTLNFPMYDGNGKICGIRTRDQDGNKRAITGSRNGVFLPTFTEDGRQPIICEGPTDSAAALALGYYPIGRQSCTGCERHVVDTCKRMGFQKVTVCADSDGPGIAGAKKLLDVLRAAKIVVRMVTPSGFKDLREWYKSGVTKEIIELQWSQAEWRT